MDGASGESHDLRDIDGKLTVFALANGMDLLKDPGARRLEWFRDGLEREIRVEPDGAGGLSIRVAAWPFGERGRVTERIHADAVPRGALPRALEAAIDAANALAADQRGADPG